MLTRMANWGPLLRQALDVGLKLLSPRQAPVAAPAGGERGHAADGGEAGFLQLNQGADEALPLGSDGGDFGLLILRCDQRLGNRLAVRPGVLSCRLLPI